MKEFDDSKTDRIGKGLVSRKLQVKFHRRYVESSGYCKTPKIYE